MSGSYLFITFDFFKRFFIKFALQNLENFKSVTSSIIIDSLLPE